MMMYTEVLVVEISLQQAKALAEKATRTWGLPEGVDEKITPVTEAAPPAPGSTCTAASTKETVDAVMDAVQKALANTPQA